MAPLRARTRRRCPPCAIRASLRRPRQCPPLSPPPPRSIQRTRYVHDVVHTTISSIHVCAQTVRMRPPLTTSHLQPLRARNNAFPHPTALCTLRASCKTRAYRLRRTRDAVCGAMRNCGVGVVGNARSSSHATSPSTTRAPRRIHSGRWLYAHCMHFNTLSDARRCPTRPSRGTIPGCLAVTNRRLPSLLPCYLHRFQELACYLVCTVSPKYSVSSQPVPIRTALT